MHKDNVFYPNTIPTSAAPSSLEAVSLPELYDTSYTPATALIDNFLYSGVYILAGPPKTGKSFLMAQLAYHHWRIIWYVCKNAFRVCSV